MGTSRMGGVPTSVPAATSPESLLDLLESTRQPVERREIAPGVVVIAGWLTCEEQRWIAEQFRQWALPPAGLRHPRVPTGHLMSVQSVCLGWHWQPYVYSRTADDTDGAPVKPLPRAIAELGQRAVGDTFVIESGHRFAPDAVIANLYAPGARLGLHHDAEEPSAAPVVTLSIGDTCLFRLAGVGRRSAPFLDVQLRSGDLLVFGGPNRRIYHGVPKVYDGTGPNDLGLPPGRLSLTIRETGFPASPGS
jgi:alkylated DNA repair protein (DNA oxidative demethylase)